MRPRQKVTRAGIQLIAAFEGLRRRAARLPDGRWTIGYGHTLSAREGAEVSQEDAEALLHFDLLPIAEAVNSLVYTPLTQNQFDALTAFAYNVGIDQFRASEVLRRVNEGRLTEAACALDLWRKADLNGDPVILDALIRRRAAEKALFLTPPDGFVPTPTPLVRPTVDASLAPALPQSRPAEIDVPMDGALAEVHRRADPEPPVSEEPVEITTSEAETIEAQPQESVEVPAGYSDDIPVETPRELEVQALEAGEPGAEGMVGPAIAPEPEPAAVSDVQPEPEPETEPAPEPEAAFPEPAPVEPVEPAVEIEPEAPFPAQTPPEPEPGPVHEPPVAAEPVPLASPPPERIYAPEAGREAEPGPPIADGGYPPGVGSPGVETPALTTESTPPPSVWNLTPPPEVLEPPPSRVEIAPEYAARRAQDDETPLFDVVADAPDQEVAQRVIRYEELEDETPVGPGRSSSGPFILMGAIGLAALGGALSAFIKARAGVDGINDLTVVAWALALIGAACVGTSVYFLLKRLGGVED